jgi:hypothetical protein
MASSEELLNLFRITRPASGCWGVFFSNPTTNSQHSTTAVDLGEIVRRIG